MANNFAKNCKQITVGAGAYVCLSVVIGLVINSTLTFWQLPNHLSSIRSSIYLCFYLFFIVHLCVCVFKLAIDMASERILIISQRAKV